MTIKSVATGAVPVIVGIFLTGIIFHFMGSNDLVKKSQAGLNG